MSSTARLWLLVVPAALALGAASSTLMAVSNHEDVPRLQAVLTALTGGSFIVAGLIARTRRPRNRTGLLLIAIGLTWFLGSGLMAANRSLAWTFGVSLAALPGGFLIHLLLAYPSGRLRSAGVRRVSGERIPRQRPANRRRRRDGVRPGNRGRLPLGRRRHDCPPLA
jgi:peptidoglycan/LPS O-acetylase OafA/YrhL